MDSLCLQNFVSKLDGLVAEYNALVSINEDKEIIRSMETLSRKYKEKISDLEHKLKIAKTKFLWEHKLRKKAEEEKNRLIDSLKLLRKSIEPETSSSVSDDFVTPNSESDFEGMVYSLRKHNTSNSSSVSITKPEKPGCSNYSKNKCPVRSKKSPDLSYLGVTSLQDKSHKPLFHSTAINGELPGHSSLASFPKSPRSVDRCEKKLFETFVLTPSNNICDSNSRLTKNIGLGSKFADDNSVEIIQSISKYAPLIPPMIPAVVIRSINEVEKRGLQEIGIYRMPSIQEDLDLLQKKFTNPENLDLSDLSVHSVAAFLKKFLHSHPLIPKPFHPLFSKITSKNERDHLFYAISLLPQANRDTLAYLMTHLRRVVSSPQCRMTVERISCIFNPIIFGLQDDKENLVSVVELFKLPSTYWASFIIEPPLAETPSKLRNSPSTELMLRRKKYFTPPNRNKKRFFSSPLEKGLEEVMTKLKIMKCFFDDIDDLMDNNNIGTIRTFKTIFEEIKTMMKKVNHDLSILCDINDNSTSDTGGDSKSQSAKSTIKNACGPSDTKSCESPSAHIKDQEITTKNPALKRNEDQPNFIETDVSKNPACDTTLDRKNMIQSNLKRFFATNKIDSNNRIKRIKLEPVTPSLSVQTSNVPQKVQQIFQGMKNRVIFNPLMNKILKEKSNCDQLDVLKKCQLIKLEATHVEQAICSVTQGSNSSTQNNTKNSDTIVQGFNQMETESTRTNIDTREIETSFTSHPILPAERPAWQWDPNVPNAKADFIFWDDRNRKVVYCCRTCFKIFQHWTLRYRHEVQLNPETRHAHFPFYTSSYYLRRALRSRSRY